MVTCFDHAFHGSEGSRAANVLPVPWECPFHGPRADTPFPSHTRPCTGRTVLTHTFSLVPPRSKAYDDYLSSQGHALCLPAGAPCHLTQEPCDSHCLRAGILRSSPAGLLPHIAMAHASLQSSGSALFEPSLLSAGSKPCSFRALPSLKSCRWHQSAPKPPCPPLPHGTCRAPTIQHFTGSHPGFYNQEACLLWQV